jgi:putative Mg2+ transporter-C (MgtC) family protein
MGLSLSNFAGPEFVPFIQMSLALLFGMILGIERVFAGRTAGPRTYGLVAVGACLATLVSIMGIGNYNGYLGDQVRIVASVITGVGFIGAGLIVFRDSKISGLTTAAGIWVAAIIGIAVGFKLYLIAFFTTFLTLFVFSIMWRLENIFKQVFANELQKDNAQGAQHDND